jgi:hypothetical protein
MRNAKDQSAPYAMFEQSLESQSIIPNALAVKGIYGILHSSLISFRVLILPGDPLALMRPLLQFPASLALAERHSKNPTWHHDRSYPV